MTRRGRAAFAWYAVTALNCGLALVIQLVLVAKGHNVLVEPDGSTAGAPERLLRFFSYFTVQSNILAAITTGILAAAVVAPPRYRLDGTWWKVTRFAAVLGMTTTIIVYVIVLAPILDLHGIAQVTDVMFHYLGPVLTLGGWLLFDRHGQVTRRLIGVVICWPLAYFVYTQVLGAISGWYPYPFLDADKHGAGSVLALPVLWARSGADRPAVLARAYADRPADAGGCRPTGFEKGRTGRLFLDRAYPLPRRPAPPAHQICAAR